MRKKWITLLLSSVLICAAFAGCSSKDSTQEESQNDKTQTETPKDSAETNGTEAADLYYEESVKISVLIDTDAQGTYGDAWDAIADRLAEKYNIIVEFENKPNGTEGDNLVKTRLAAGEMTDILFYNAGAGFKALNPEEYFLDLSDQEFTSKLDETYLESVTVDGKTYGVPGASSTAGGIVYNKEIYEELNLEIPLTWEEFLANCDACKEAGYDGILGTYKDDWSSQYILLSDNYNVIAEYPEFAQDLEQNKAKFEDTEIALRSWEKLSDSNAYLNSDYLAASIMDGIDKMLDFEAVHWPITSQLFAYFRDLSSAEDANKFGFFALPGDHEDSNGVTVWMPSSWYISKTSKNQEAALKFMEFYISDEGMEIFKEYCGADGPFLVEGIELPEDTLDGVKDLQQYFDNGNTTLALEFMTSLKGASAAQICAECGSGSMSAKEAAKVYDDDCTKMAQQLGLEGWE